MQSGLLASMKNTDREIKLEITTVLYFRPKGLNEYIKHHETWRNML